MTLTTTSSVSSYAIRAVREGDLPGLLELYVHLNADNAVTAGEERLREVWAQVLSDPKLHCFVAEADGRLVGTCLLAVVPNLTRGARSFGVIENVVTHGEYRRRGIGTGLMRHALAAAWGEGCYKVMLLSGSRRVETHRFYEGLGFRRDTKVGFVAVPESPPPPILGESEQEKNPEPR